MRDFSRPIAEPKPKLDIWLQIVNVIKKCSAEN